MRLAEREPFRFCELGATKCRVKPRYAAALALVGWYLMTPPLIKGTHDTYTIYRSAPLSEWILQESYDSAAQCEDSRPGFVGATRRVVISAGRCAETGPCNEPLLESATLAHCIASDDPRLKKK